ncbi:MAG: hypothetical protein DRI99_00325 [Candidatus Aminicenantes bacterium]|nr:cupin domain-containing protein [Candidatus Aminicenantes bacterium]OQX53458.1 MAG: hypothetical protein B5M54_06775 [Candidatus Aminicenantes bacterium 4484_214]RLE04461.1 MAG: hypothetical protein DRJ11_00890 [Candidatus Aminicenantes bacterium]RLE06212.1 MAG: hypothetical protein DRI99_00325 [Candidatus Aminicenantes bacterium]HHF42837.1 cupin domain-containing protein [Candidatus Aminicenantes bacterium]
MPYIKKDNHIKVEVFEGVTRITLACGKDILLARFEYKKGSRVPPHSHAYEQVTHVLKGKQRIIIMMEDKREDFIVEEGDSYIVPANHDHEQITLEEAITIDSWSLAI